MAGESSLTDEVSKQPRGKALRGFYVAMGAILALTVGGWFAWPQIKLHYAIHQLKTHAPGAETPAEWQEWVELVTDASWEGHRGAIDALIKQGDKGCWASLFNVANWPAKSRTAFYEQLSRWPDDDEFLSALYPVSEGIESIDRKKLSDDYESVTAFSPEEFATLMARLQKEQISHRVQELTSEFLDALKRRFPEAKLE
jgi:hypothetical protein